ncbi:MAG: hypothetical protein OQJ97_03060 [Rhodospirillales bacterium]|nr:hypothetical protein [Rhodospirillales bacterium]
MREKTGLTMSLLPKYTLILLWFFTSALLIPVEVFAQEAGKTRAQGKVIGNDKPVEEPEYQDDLVDYREDMRTFIQNIANFGRRVNPNFVVLTLNGADLLTKREDGDEDRRVPAEKYLRAIDGVIQESLYYGAMEVDQETLEKERKELLPKLEAAKKRGIKVLTLDYAKTTKKVSSIYSKSRKKGFIPYVAPAKGIELNKIAKYPRRPIGENPSSVTTLDGVKNYTYLLDTTAYGSQGQFAMKLHDNNFDMVVLEPFYRKNKPLTFDNVNIIKSKKLGSRRLVLAYVNIGMAEAFRYYWKPQWREGRPTWVKAPKVGYADKYFVEFWRPEWQRLMFGTPTSYIYGLIRDLGFDGVVLDGVEAYRFFEGEEE